MEINYKDEICQYTQDIWQQILGLEVQPTEEDFKLESYHTIPCPVVSKSWEPGKEASSSFAPFH